MMSDAFGVDKMSIKFEAATKICRAYLHTNALENGRAALEVIDILTADDQTRYWFGQVCRALLMVFC